MKRRDILTAAMAAGALKVEAQQMTSGPEDLNGLARRNMKSNREAIDKVKLPMAVEPAFAFKA